MFFQNGCKFPKKKISLALEINLHTFNKTNVGGFNIKPNPLNL